VRISRRPSKFALWRLLEADLRPVTGPVGIDAACAAFKSYEFFHTASYYGVDIDFDAIEMGLDDHPEAVGIFGDLTELDLPSSCADVCVSTNTFHWLPSDRKRGALDRLVHLVKADGRLIIELHRDVFLDEALELLHDQFEDVEVKYFCNPVSRWYEDWLWSHNYLEPRAGWLAKMRIGIAWVLSGAEELFPHSSKGKSQAYVRCDRRRDAGPAHEVVLEPARRITERIYAATAARADARAASQ
jgi:SAM-dependent methyltransferase